MAITRRDVLKYGVFGALAVAAGGIGLGLRPTVLRKPEQPLHALDDTEYSILWAIAEVICPANGAFPAASSLQVAEKVDALLASSDPGLAVDVKRLLRLVENAIPGLILDRRFHTFSAASETEQALILEGWRTSAIPLRRTVYKALNGLVGATYYAQPEVWPAVGYPGPPNYGNFTGGSR